MNFDTDAALMYLCETSAFRPCRIQNVIENSQCNGMQTSGGVVIYDVIFLVLSILVGLFLAGAVGMLKGIRRIYKKQRKSRGVSVWRAHFSTMGIQIIVWGLSVCVTPTMGYAQNVMIAFRYFMLCYSETLLLLITLIDIQLIPTLPKCFTVSYNIIAFGFGLSAFLILKGTSTTILFYCLVYPFFVQCWHFFAMLIVCIIRKSWKGLGFLFGMFIFGLVPLIIDLAPIGAMCSGTSGFFTPQSLAVIFYAIYRVFGGFFFKQLKNYEKYDGLFGKKKRLGESSSSDHNAPGLIDISDYSYEYTWTDSAEFNRLNGN